MICLTPSEIASLANSGSDGFALRQTLDPSPSIKFLIVVMYREKIPRTISSSIFDPLETCNASILISASILDRNASRCAFTRFGNLAESRLTCASCKRA
ncbi:MAG: hypothetical protein EBT75_03355 [Proteobacteria bacterium]|nr:hypothetical protein [Pseudomonadota bacterium]